METFNFRTRVVLVLALPPPKHASPVDLDLLDCLQQEAMSPMLPPSAAGCAGLIKLPHCTPKPQDKADKVFMRCGGEGSKMGVGVICWGCSVWHRWVAQASYQVNILPVSIAGGPNTSQCSTFRGKTCGTM